MADGKKSNSASKDNRRRNFCCVVYPESAPVDWLDTIGAACVPCFISPLHDEDINPTGEPKKAHYHVMVMYDGKKSKEQVVEFFTSFGGVGCEVVQNLRGYARYLCHLDNPEKHQYDPEQVKTFGGADYISAIGLPTDKYEAVDAMIDFCEAYNITSFSYLVNYARKNRRDWFRCLCDNSTYIVKEYLRSKRWTNAHGEEVPEVDPVTGELLDPESTE